MQSSNQPGKISLPFANSGAKQPIPVASQVGIEDGRASYTDGFPPLTRTPLTAGGKPPFGTDMNGILNAITAIQQWQSAGGLFTYDSALSTSIGGYPKGAILLKSDGSGCWQSTVENNVSNPDSSGAGWSDLSAANLGVPSGAVQAFAMSSAPSGWIHANGAAISRVTYSRLFSAIGTTFGAGDGVSTFSVPDLRGEFIRGFDAGRGVDPSRSFGSSQAGDIQSHAHALDGETVGSGSGSTVSDANGQGTVRPYGNTATSGGTETRPRNIALLYCIKI